MEEPEAKAGCGVAFIGLLLVLGVALLLLSDSDFVTDPDSPRVLKVFGAVIIVGAIAFIVPMRRALARQAEAKRQRTAHPDEPWTWRPEWNQQRLEPTGRGSVWFMGFFALVWNAISFGVLFAILFQGEGDNTALLFALIFPLVGLGLLAWAIRLFLQRRKYRGTTFLPSSLPGAIGGYLGGVIHLPVALQGASDIRLSLQAVRTEVRGSGKNRHVHHKVLWEDEAHVKPGSDPASGRRAHLPVLFYIPPDLPPSEVKRRDPRTYWKLRARARVPGIDFDAAFEVPVFVTGEPVPPPSRDQPLLPEYDTTSIDSPAALAEAGVQFLPTGRNGHPSYRFGSSKLGGARLVFPILALGATVGTVALAWNGLWLPAGVVFFFAFFLVYAAGSVWGRDREIEIGPNDVVLRRRTFGGLREDRYPRDQIGGVRIENSMQQGETRFFRIMLDGTSGSDPQVAARGEPFALRKARYQLRRHLKKAGTTTPDPNDPAAQELVTRIRSLPRFQVMVAPHVRGGPIAESLRRRLEETIKS